MRLRREHILTQKRSVTREQTDWQGQVADDSMLELADRLAVQQLGPGSRRKPLPRRILRGTGSVSTAHPDQCRSHRHLYDEARHLFGGRRLLCAQHIPSPAHDSRVVHRRKYTPANRTTRHASRLAGRRCRLRRARRPCSRFTPGFGLMLCSPWSSPLPLCYFPSTSTPTT